RSLVAGSCACRVAGIAGQAFSPALEPPRSVSPNHRCRTSGVDAGRSLDSEILHVDGTTDAAGPAILFSAGNDGGNGGNGGKIRRRAWSDGGRSARNQKFGCAFCRRVEKSDRSRPPCGEVRPEKGIRQAAGDGCTLEARRKHID